MTYGQFAAYLSGVGIGSLLTALWVDALPMLVVVLFIVHAAASFVFDVLSFDSE